MTALLLVLGVAAPAVTGLLIARREGGAGYAVAGLFAGLALSWVGVLIVVADRRAVRRARRRAVNS